MVSGMEMLMTTVLKSVGVSREDFLNTVQSLMSGLEEFKSGMAETKVALARIERRIGVYETALDSLARIETQLKSIERAVDPGLASVDSDDDIAALTALAAAGDANAAAAARAIREHRERINVGQ